MSSLVATGVVAVAADGAAVSGWLGQVVALVVAAAGIAYVCQRLRIVPMVGFLLAGVLIGPHAAGLVRNQQVVEAAAEIGVLLLLFTIGMEFSFERLLALRRLILGGGPLQVGLTTAVVALLVVSAGGTWQVGVFSGFLVALSSTAIVLKVQADRGTLRSPAGQIGVGLLLFQDLAVIAMVLLVPLLGQGDVQGPTALVRALVAAVLVVVLVVVGARRLVPRLLESVARACSPEVFLLTVVAICLGTALLTSLAGVSLSLGAFLAGLVISESRFAGQALGEILPLQILFSATFFVSVGMLLDLRFVVENPLLVLAVVGVVVAVKVSTTTVAARVVGGSTRVALAAGLALAQVGEFAFVLERVGQNAGLSAFGVADGAQLFIAASVLLMVATPLLTALGDRVARRGATSERSERDRGPGEIRTGRGATSERSERDRGPGDISAGDHVVVAGYGRAARTITEVLRAAGLEHVVVTLNPDGAEEVEAAGARVVRGDAGRQRTLLTAGVDRARVVVVADDDPDDARRIAQVARNLNPDAAIVVRTRQDVEVSPLVAAGASHVVSDEHATALAVTERVLRALGAPEDVVRREVTGRWRRSMLGDVDGGGSQDMDDIERARRLGAFGTVVDTRTTVDQTYQADGCEHVGRIRPVVASAPGCEDCLAIDARWVHLRLCLTCGHVGCCDSSPNRHATAHYRTTGHPIVASAEPDEDWAWCFVDEQPLLPVARQPGAQS